MIEAIKQAIYLYAEQGNPHNLTEFEFHTLQAALRIARRLA